MHDAERVRGAQRGEDLKSETGRLSGAEQPLLEDEVTQGSRFEQLHDDPRAAVFFQYVEDLDDVVVA